MRIEKNNLVGQVFNRLTVISREPNRHAGDRAKIRYSCSCVCGNTVSVLKERLVAGHTKSCGCLQREKAAINGKIGKLPFGEKPKNDIYSNYRNSAKVRGYLFQLSKSNFFKIIKENCFYCDSPPSNIRTNGKDITDYYIYSGIDRIDSSIGYVSSNIVSCCATCNYAKSQLTQAQFYKWAEGLANNLTKKKLICQKQQQ